jgi:hypothetical protein
MRGLRFAAVPDAARQNRRPCGDIIANKSIGYTTPKFLAILKKARETATFTGLSKTLSTGLSTGFVDDRLTH